MNAFAIMSETRRTPEQKGQAARGLENIHPVGLGRPMLLGLRATGQNRDWRAEPRVHREPAEHRGEEEGSRRNTACEHGAGAGGGGLKGKKPPSGADGVLRKFYGVLSL